MKYHDFELIYGLGLDELLLGDDEGKFADATPEEREALAAIGAAASVGGDGSPSMLLGLAALLRVIGF